jgi:hypothetical protein
MPRSEKVEKTIDEVLKEFLAEQKARLGGRTYSNYEGVIHWLRSYCESYWPGHDGEYDAVTKAGGTFCGRYGPEDIAEAFSMFLDYFIPRKCLGPQVWIDAAPTVIKKLAKWLVQKGYDPDAKDAVEWL